MSYPKNRAWDGDFPPKEHATWLADAPASSSQYQLMEGINGFLPSSALFPGGLRISSTKGEVDWGSIGIIQYRVRGNAVAVTEQAAAGRLRIDAPATATLADVVSALASTSYTSVYVGEGEATTVVPSESATYFFEGGAPDRRLVCEVNSEGPVFIVRGTEMPTTDTDALLAIRGGGIRFTIEPGDSLWARSGNTQSQHYGARCWMHEK